ncbi:PilW family protein [Sporosalibacterium faouarense]|uniref:PilW family protein n=1 Tax=Sporosalibacterium faouarense TaxID=516123 RepID=UPI00141C48A2|nr:prepilin-type N-terminal cleavage/methylation domain-containing protein [Sporosalibacterium faouarense]MTI48210.1 prepilin-type N-terminal cleavage/methylation domain-containing protein [Bacillota bacterium]
MKKIKSNLMLSDQGITLIELLVTLAIVGIVLTMVTSFFIANLNNFNRAEDELDLQYEAQATMNYITEIAIQSRSIVSLEDSEGVNQLSYDGNDKIELGEIAFDFEYIDDETDNESIRDESFRLDLDNRVLIHDGKEVGRYINNVKVNPIPSGTEFSKARGLNIVIEMSEDNNTKRIESQVYFRNYEE